MRLIKVGNKLISWEKISSAINEILQRRSTGATQQEVASDFGIERVFISYLESIGAIQRNQSLAVVCWLIDNLAEVSNLVGSYGVEMFNLVPNSTSLSHIEVNDICRYVIEVLAKVKKFQALIVIGDRSQVELFREITDQDVYAVRLIRTTRAKGARLANISGLERILRALIGDGLEVEDERSHKHKSWIFKKRSSGRSRIPG
jgi:hypothetical protein